MKDDTTYKVLHEKELTRHEVVELAWAMKELSEGFTAHNAWDVLRHTTNAIRYINEFRGNIVPTTDLTAEEANLSVSLHTYMRKGMDCPLGTMLYRLISENRGTNVWYAFVRGLATVKNSGYKRAYQTAIAAAEKTYDSANDTTDDLLMLSTLRLWEDDFHYAIKWIEGK